MNIEILTKGTGAMAKVGQKVVCHYTGKLLDGKVFDSSVTRGTPFKFNVGVGQVIKAWDEGFLQIPVGTKAVITAPSDYAYGDRGYPPVIPAKATLIFEVEFLSIE